MTNVLWKNTAGGNWGTASDWNDDVVPNDASDQVYLPTLTSAYTVTADGDYTVNYLEVDAKATLSITGGQINIDNNALGDSGTVNVGKGATLALTGNFIGVYGSGALVVDGALSVDTTSFAALFNSKITLAGGSLLGSTATVNYTENYEATISGYGVIGDGWSVSTGGSNNSDSVGLSLSNANGATINANGSTGKALTLDTGANWIENGGVIESTGAGGLVIESSVWQDGTLTASGTAGITVEGSVQNGSVQLGGLGTTAVLAGSQLVLNDVIFISGGTLNVGTATAAGGLVTTTAGNLGSSKTADELRTDIHNYGKIVVVNDSELMVNATFLNGASGQLDLNASTGEAILELVNSGSSAYGGAINLSNDVGNQIISDGSYTQFSNYSTISGSGLIGDGYLRLFNGTSGVIDANGRAGLTIVADTAGYNQNTQTNSNDNNDGLIEATSSGVLTFDAGAFNNSAKILAASNGEVVLDGALVNGGGGEVDIAAGGKLLVENGADISNQSLMTVGASGTLTTSADGAEDEIETSIFNSGTVDFVSDSTVLTQKKWVNDGTINIGTVGAASGAEIVVDAGDSLDVLDGGAINLDNAKDSIVAAGGGSQFWNRGNTIVGEGTIGDANLYIQNVLGATIDATGVLVLGNSTSAPTIGNGGLLEASNGGTLTIENNIDNTGDILVKAGGNLLASGQVQDTGRVDLDGGTAEFGSWVNNLIYFDAGVSSTLILDNPASNEDGGITGFAAGGANAIDFKNFKYGDGKFTNLGGGNAFDDWLELQNSLGQDSVGIGLDGNFTAAAGSFKFSEDKWGGTIVHWTPKA